MRRLDLVRAYNATAALLTVGDAILQAYHRAKRQAGALDFNDLIGKTCNLLSRSDAAQWVLYKLDRRIEHILVDEAQDTSPDQWMVVQAIAEDFFSGKGAARSPRTIFAVGDDKQSIFRFQGAVPAMLSEMERFFRERVEDAQETFVTRPLYLSFRSTHEVLSAVDEVFEEPLAAQITASTYTAHASHRASEPGHVVLLPRAVRRRAEDPEDWTAPYTAPSAAETELAGHIADEVLRIRNTVLPSGKRLTDGEILILVRRRDAFAAAMNRALRERQIPTAGADRIPVSTHIAVLDLLALADVMLLPADDLQLAACLKSPLLGLSEDELMRLATGRERKSLWRALRDATEEPFASVAKNLRRWHGMADQVTPFQFFATLLGPEGGRRRFRARLGGEADDMLDTFLSQALAYEATEPPSLQGFVRFIRANASDIKRETEEGAVGVRVMTVHGAKGLEADVVFLADTGGAAVVPQQRKLLVDIGIDRGDPAFLWRRRQAEAPDVQQDADRREDKETESEYLRLLYVAMTRARDVLYVAGVRLLKPPPRSGTRSLPMRFCRRMWSVTMSASSPLLISGRKSGGRRSPSRRKRPRLKRRSRRCRLGFHGRRRRPFRRLSRFVPRARCPSPIRRQVPPSLWKLRPARRMRSSAAASCISCSRSCPPLTRLSGGLSRSACSAMRHTIRRSPARSSARRKPCSPIRRSPASSGRRAAPRSILSASSRRRRDAMP